MRPWVPLALAILSVGAASAPAGAFPAPSAGPAAGGQESPTVDQSITDLQRARRLFAQHRYREARELLMALLEQRPDDPEARLLLGRTLLVLGDWAGAEDSLERAAASQGPTPFMVDHTRGMVSLRQRRWAEAESRFSEALERAPLYTGSLIGRAQARAFQGRVDAALEDLRTAERSPRPQPAARLLAGELLLARGNMEGAFQAFEALASAEERTPASENAGMYLATMAPDLDETESRILRGISNALQRAAPYFWLAMVYRERGDDDGARRLLGTALRVDDLHAPSWVALRTGADPPPTLEDVAGPPLPGIDHRMSRLGARLESDPATVAAEAREILEQRPGFVPALLLIVEAARQEEDPVALLRALEQLSEVVPELPDAHAERAMIARDLGSVQLAEREADAAVELLPDDGSLRYLLCTVLAAGGDAAEGMTECQAALDLGYEVASLHMVLGNLYQEMQRLPEAIDHLERAVEMEPAMAERIAGFALTAMTAADTDRLAALLERALDAAPDSPNVLYALGSLYQRQGDPERAVTLFERVLELVPGSSEVHYNLALAYRRLGREQDAERQTRRFEELKAQEDREFEAANATYRRRAEAIRALADGDAERAVELLEQVVGTVGSEPGDQALLGSALLAADRPQDAAAAYRRFLEANPYDARALCGAASAAERLGDNDEATGLRARVDALGKSCPAPAGGPG